MEKLGVFRTWLIENGVTLPSDLHITPVKWGLGVSYSATRSDGGGGGGNGGGGGGGDDGGDGGGNSGGGGGGDDGGGGGDGDGSVGGDGDLPPPKRLKRTLITAIPHRLLLHPHYCDDMQEAAKILKVWKHEWKNNCKERGHPVQNFDLVVIYWFLVRERRNLRSFWRPYLDILQSEFDTPLFWNQDELAVIEGTNLYEGTQKINDWLDITCKILQKCDEHLTKSELVWAYSVFTSRAIGVNIHDNTQVYTCDIDSTEVVPTLVPLVDVFNHNHDAKVKFITDNKKKEFLFEVECDQVPGKEIWNNYGMKTNEQFLLSYGFMQDDHFGSYWVQLALSGDDPLAENKMDLLKTKKLGLRHYMSKYHIPEEFFVVTRILLMDPMEYYFSNFSVSPDQVVSGKTIFSFKNEALVYQTVLTLLESRRRRFTDLGTEKDKVLLNSNLSFKKKLALSYLIEQKEILNSCIEQIRKMEAEFITQGNYSEQIINPLFKEISPEKIIPWIQNFSNSEMECIHETQKFFQRIIDNDRECCFQLDFPYENSLNMDRFKKVFGDPSTWETLPEEDTALCLLLIHEKSKNSHSDWYPFLDALPEKFFNGLYFTDQHFELLEENSISVAAMELQGHVTEQFYQIVKPLQKNDPDMFPAHVYTKEALKWAYAVNLIFGVDSLGDEGPRRCIVPLLPPMYNPKIINQWEYSKASSILILSSRAPNHYFVGNFDNKSNEELVLSHGIFSRENPNDYLVVDLENFIDSVEVSILEENGMGTVHFLKKEYFPTQILSALECTGNEQSPQKRLLDILNRIKTTQKTIEFSDTVSQLINLFLISQREILENVISMMVGLIGPIK